MHTFKRYLQEKHLENHTNHFINYACQHLGIDAPPQVSLVDDKAHAKENKSFGGYMPANRTIRVNSAGRHTADILRTLAHELVHHKQNLDGRLNDVASAGETGSDIENEANSVAGVIMRNYARINPAIFEEAQVGHPPGHLHIFDVDDTLFHTSAKIGVMKGGKRVRSLTNQEYNNYKWSKDEEPDYSEFRSAKKFSQESVPVHGIIAKFKAIHKNIEGMPNHRVVINTARADFDDKHEFLHTFRKHGIDIDHSHVYRAGNDNQPGSVGEKKARIIRKQLASGRHNQVSLYDDSMHNLHHFLALKKEFPHIKFHAHHVQPNGSTKKIKDL